VISLRSQVWVARALILGSLFLLCVLADSRNPALALAVAWGPNGFFLYLFMKGRLRLPRMLEPVHDIEPVLYRGIGIGLVKRIVETRLWPLLNGFEPPPSATSRRELLDRTELTSQGAEICHAATFVLALSISLVCLVVGQVSFALWLLAFNILLNGYPVMLQRCHRSRIRHIRSANRSR
jgi:hypothetical protein